MSITFEHPLKEHVRVFLRIENLFSELDQLMRFGYDAGVVLTLMSAIIKCLERPDLKSKLTNVLYQQYMHLRTFSGNPDIEPKKLNVMLEKIDAKLSLLKSHSGLNALMPEPNLLLKKYQAELTSHGAVALFADPVLCAWDQVNAIDAEKLINNWRLDLENIYSIIQLVLSLIRQGSSFKEVVCNGSFYGCTFANDVSLIRVRLCSGIVPEFSAGGRRLALRFQEVSFTNPKIDIKDVEVEKFDISFCI